MVIQNLLLPSQFLACLDCLLQLNWQTGSVFSACLAGRQVRNGYRLTGISIYSKRNLLTLGSLETFHSQSVVRQASGDRHQASGQATDVVR